MTKGERPYHKYVFDEVRRQFVGRFEEMYRHEDVEGYDSWYQEDLTGLTRQISLAILSRYNFDSVLDLGCGKGSFTHLLKRENNVVLGVDVSETAVAKARVRYPSIDFRVMDVSRVDAFDQRRFDLVIAMELLSYIAEWRDLLRRIAAVTRYLYITLYLPPTPIGYVKSFDELLGAVGRYFSIETQLFLNGAHLFLFARTEAGVER